MNIKATSDHFAMPLPYKIFLLSSALSMLSLITVSPAHASENVAQSKRWAPVVDFTYKGGNNRSYGTASMMVPLAQDEDSMVFADLRTVVSDYDTFEGNAGIGVRKIAGDDAIFGAYGFLDARNSEYDNRFLQATIGAEVIGEHFDLRGNMYVPIGEDKKQAYDNGASAFISGSNIMLQDGRVYESALKGFDVEIGHSFPVLENARGYLGYYSFHNDGVSDVNGYRARVEADIGDWIEIGAEKQFSDTTQDDSVFGEIRIRIPFDGWKKGSTRRKTMSPLQQKMMTPIVRDIDIVTGTLAPPEPVVAVAADGSAPSKVYFVDNTAGAGGDGSMTSPFNTLAAAEAAAGAYDTIYVASGDGTTTGYDAGLTLSETGQRLIGSGSALTVDLSQIKIPEGFGTVEGLEQVVLKQASSTNPTITNAGGDGITVTGNNTTVSGVTVDSAGDDNIYVYNVDDVTIENVTSTNAGGEGFYIVYNEDKKYKITINNNILRNNGSGIFIRSANSSLVTSIISNNSTKENGGQGIYLRSADSSSITTIVKNNVVINNGGAGIFLGNLNTSTLNGTVYKNTVSNNGWAGIVVYGYGTNILNATIDSNTINNNDNSGIILRSDDTSTIKSFVKNNTISGGSLSGILQRSYGSSTLVGTTTNNIVHNSHYGILLQSANTSTFHGSVSYNNLTNNTGNGIFFDDDSTLSMIADLGGGVLGSAGENSIFNNTGTEIRIDLDGDELSAENNWWGVDTGLDPAETTLDAGSTIDADPYLTEAP